MRNLTVLTLLALITSAASPSVLAAKGHAPAAHPTPASRGLAFATSHCAACHAIAAGQISPNPEAPPWELVVNKPGLTRATLRTFLRDSHNYPQAMNFTIDQSQIDDLAAYMLTLKSAQFKPPIQ